MLQGNEATYDDVNERMPYLSVRFERKEIVGCDVCEWVMCARVLCCLLLWCTPMCMCVFVCVIAFEDKCVIFDEEKSVKECVRVCMCVFVCVFVASLRTRMSV